LRINYIGKHRVGIILSWSDEWWFCGVLVVDCNMIEVNALVCVLLCGILCLCITHLINKTNAYLAMPTFAPFSPAPQTTESICFSW